MGLPVVQRPAFFQIPSDPRLLKDSRLILQMPRKDLAVVGIVKGAIGDQGVQAWVGGLASVGFGRIVVQHLGNDGSGIVGDFVQPRPGPGLPSFDRRFQLRDDPSRRSAVALVYGDLDARTPLVWPPKAVDVINESVEPPGEGPLFPTPIRVESIIADPPARTNTVLMQEKADLLVEVDVETNAVSVLRPKVPGTPRDMQSLLRSLNAAGDIRKSLAVVTFTGKFAREFPWDELDKWIDAPKSAGFQHIIITEQTGNDITSGDGEPLREWPASPRRRTPRPSPPPFTLDLLGE
ncbi:MAG: hypothetical protein ACHRHE_22535 [Tepidisphaerales bacterium]